MNSIEFTRDTTGIYTIADNNDERLYCIGLILNLAPLRNGVKKALRYAPEIGTAEVKKYESSDYRLHLSPTINDTVYLKLFEKNDSEKVLETDMPLKEFLALIDAFEDALILGPESIIITREQDTFTLRTF